MNANAKSYIILRGPGRDTLYEAMKYAYDYGVKIPIGFEVVDSLGHKIEIQDLRICSIEHESGTGYNLNLRGYVDLLQKTEYVPCKFSAYYDAKIRRGHIEVTRG